MKTFILITLVLSSIIVRSQSYPSFGPEKDVTINGLTFDAMEPFISNDGKYLFFNNLNDGINTKLFYSERLNDSTFNFIGELNGTNQPTPPHLDGVADMDSLNNFYWTSTRDYPMELDNLFHGTFDAGNVTSIGRVHGDFNKSIPGWLVMDHGISWDGQHLYYSNARFDNNNCQGPCETELGVAQKVNDSTFNQIPNSNSILQNINDSNYIYYAPCITSDDLELYYTRYLKGNITTSTSFEICVAVRDEPTANFSDPKVLFSETIANLIEAPTLTADKQIMYYHKKTSNSHKVVMRYRGNTVGVNPLTESNLKLTIYPNPSKTEINIKTNINYGEIKLSVITLFGESVITTTNQPKIDISSLFPGIYFLKYELDGKTGLEKFNKID